MNSTSNIVCVFKTFFPHFLSNSSIFWFSNHRRQVYIESKANLVGVKAWKNWAKEVEGWEWKGNGSWIFEAKRSEFSSGSRWEVLVKGIVVRVVVVIVIEMRIFKNARFFSLPLVQNTLSHFRLILKSSNSQWKDAHFTFFKNRTATFFHSVERTLEKYEKIQLITFHAHQVQKFKS